MGSIDPVRTKEKTEAPGCAGSFGLFVLLSKKAVAPFFVLHEAENGVAGQIPEVAGEDTHAEDCQGRGGERQYQHG